MLQKLGRVLREKAGGDLQQIFQGTEKTREKFGVRTACNVRPWGIAGLILRSAQGVDELIAYWTLESSEDALEELEETLIVRAAAAVWPATCSGR